MGKDFRSKNAISDQRERDKVLTMELVVQEYDLFKIFSFLSQNKDC